LRSLFVQTGEILSIFAHAVLHWVIQLADTFALLIHALIPARVICAPCLFFRTLAAAARLKKSTKAHTEACFPDTYAGDHIPDHVARGTLTPWLVDARTFEHTVEFPCVCQIANLLATDIENTGCAGFCLNAECSLNVSSLLSRLGSTGRVAIFNSVDKWE